MNNRDLAYASTTVFILILWRDQGPTGVSERCKSTFKSNLQDNLWVFPY